MIEDAKYAFVLMGVKFLEDIMAEGHEVEMVSQCHGSTYRE